ncbi:MAG: Na+:solute symporter [Phycisphaerae bacterium]|nr:Na+:solute symporter [Phycisphaerae bacterium]
MSLPLIDQAIIVVYLLGVIALGIIVSKAASKNIDSYFLGGRQTPWWVLGASGSSSYFDITGTMWIVSLFMLYGVKGMWEQWIWGFTYAAFFMTFMGKWIRRSNVLTGAEWMKTRFGDGVDSECARAAYAFLAVVTVTAFLAYGWVGMGKFGETYMPWSRNTCALVIIGVTSIYVIMGGFISVVLNEFLQTIILSLGVIVLSVFAFVKASGNEAVQKLAQGEWGNMTPPWRMEVGGYEMFGLLVIVWVAKGLIQEFGGPPQMYDFQRFLATRDSRDACKVGALWGVIHVLRWPMVAAIVILAISGLGGAHDPEKVLPLVLREHLPAGLRGFVLAALLAAFMSTFDATVNTGAAYVVKDLYQRYLRREAGDRELVWASYIATALLVVVGVVVGYRAESIARMFQWIMGALGAGVMIPCVLRWYWWRFNGWGFTVGTLSGIATALIQARWFADAPLWQYFPILTGISVVVCVAATFVTPATDRATLKRFYMTVHPGGWWGPIARAVATEHPEFRKEPFGWELFNSFVAVGGFMGLYFFPIFLMLRRWPAMWGWLAVAVVCGVVLFFTWYRRLPAAGVEAVTDGECVIDSRGDAVGES